LLSNDFVNCQQFLKGFIRRKLHEAEIRFAALCIT